VRSAVYVGAFSFPDRDAGGLRVLGVGRALREAGYRVLFVGVEKGGRPQDRIPSGEHRYDGFTYVPDKEPGRSWSSRLARAVQTHVTGQTTINRLKEFHLAFGSAIIAYGAPASLLWRLRRFCWERRIALLADCVEWYDPWHVTWGPFGPFFWDSELRMRWMHPKVGRLITISSFLADYYRGRGCNVIRVPPLVDMRDEWRAAFAPPEEDAVLRLVYSGSPGKKDLLAAALRGLHRLGSTRRNVEFHLVGLDRSALSRLLGKDRALLPDLGNRVICHGRMPHAAALRIVAVADFSVLLRSDQRYAQAGFPSKLVESLSLGVPVIGNVTSDIGEYVSDGREGVVLDEASAEAFEAGVRRALDMSRHDRLAMRERARTTALGSFDYRNYVSGLRDFVDDAIETSRCN
jgi:glycosyltransferase involved in cell wall biosynthesis